MAPDEKKFSIREVETREELDELIDLIHYCYHRPYRPEHQLFHPVFGHTEQEQLASMQAEKERRWQAHTNGPSSHWIYIVDNDTQKAVGCVQWVIFEKNPFPNGPKKIEATWFPEGEMREFTNQVANQIFYPVMNLMPRPHLTLNQMCVLPSYRNRGLGRMLMSWGVQRADELDLECFTQASADAGTYLYEKVGFKYLFSVAINPKRGRREPSDVWIRLTHEYLPHTGIDYVWRPAKSMVREGGPNSPFEVVPRVGD